MNTIELKDFEVPDNILEILIKDQTTGKNIVWGTDQYGYGPDECMTFEQVKEKNPRPRILKSLEDQKSRTDSKAEVFTPFEIIKKMNDSVDKDFDGGYMDYIKRTVLEITCGEAPYLVSRYDVSTGEKISLENREGLLDRKMKKVNELVENKQCAWWPTMCDALNSTYGYEFQGDSLLLARINIFKDINDWYNDLTGEDFGDMGILVARMITLNIIQMDGLTMTIPFTEIPALVMDWEKDEMVRFDDQPIETPLF